MTSTQSKALERGDEKSADPASYRADARRLAIFEDRYGPGSYDRLLTWLQQPCMSFAEIATRLNVTRERVRQWHRRIMPGAPTGRERRRQCGLYQQKKRLLTDPLFRVFYRHVRQHYEGSRFEPLRSGTGFRTRLVRIDDRLVAIREAGRANRSRPTWGAYRLARYRGEAEFVYFKLGADDFLVMPAALLPPHGATLAADSTPRYQPFRNTFAALRTAARQSA